MGQNNFKFNINNKKMITLPKNLNITVKDQVIIWKSSVLLLIRVIGLDFPSPQCLTHVLKGKPIWIPDDMPDFWPEIPKSTPYLTGLAKPGYFLGQEWLDMTSTSQTVLAKNFDKRTEKSLAKKKRLLSHTMFTS